MDLRCVRSSLSEMCIPLAAATLLATAGIWLWTRPAYATASDTWSAYTVGFTAESLLDPSARSVWTPGALPAHVDFDLRGRRRVRVLAVTNADDFPHHDLSSDSFLVQLFDGEREVFAERRRFATPTSREKLAPRVVADRIRVTVESSHGPRACLADVTWE